MVGTQYPVGLHWVSLTTSSVTTSRFLYIKITDCNVKKFGYSENPLITSSIFCIFLLVVSGTQCIWLCVGGWCLLRPWFGFGHLYAELDEGVDHRPGRHVLAVHLTHDGAHVVFVRDEVGVLGAQLRQLGLVRRLEGRHAAGLQRFQQRLEVRREREEHDVLGLGPLDHPRAHVTLARVVQHQYRVLWVPGHRDVAVLPEVARQDFLYDGATRDAADGDERLGSGPSAVSPARRHLLLTCSTKTGRFSYTVREV